MQSGPAPGSRSHAAVPAAVSNTHDTPLARDHTYEYSDPAAGAVERVLPASTPHYAVPGDDGGYYTAPDATQPAIYDRQSDRRYAVPDAPQPAANDAQNNAARAKILCFHPVEREECELKLNQAVLGGGSWFMTRAKAGATVLSYVIEKPEAARYVNVEGATERGVQHRKIVQNASDGSFETTQSGEQLTLGLTLPSAVSKLVDMLDMRFACKVNGLQVVQPVVAMPITVEDTYEAGEVGAAVVSATLPMEAGAGDELYYDGGKDKKVRAGFTVDAAPGSAPASNN